MSAEQVCYETANLNLIIVLLVLGFCFFVYLGFAMGKEVGYEDGHADGYEEANEEEEART